MLGILLQSLNESKNCKIFLESYQPLDPLTEIGTNRICLSTPCFARILPNMQYVDIFTVWRLHHIPHLGSLGFLNLKEKQSFSVWSFYWKSPFIFSHGGVCSKYSKQLSLKKAKTYLSKNKKNTLKNVDFKGNFKYKETVCFIGYSL